MPHEAYFLMLMGLGLGGGGNLGALEATGAGGRGTRQEGFPGLGVMPFGFRFSNTFIRMRILVSFKSLLSG